MEFIEIIGRNLKISDGFFYCTRRNSPGPRQVPYGFNSVGIVHFSKSL